MIIILKKILDLPKSKSQTLIASHSFFLFSVFDSVPIPYPKREYIVDDDSSTVTKTEPTMMLKAEASSVTLTQQQHSLVQTAQAQQVNSFQALPLPLRFVLDEINAAAIGSRPTTRKENTHKWWLHQWQCSLKSRLSSKS